MKLGRLDNVGVFQQNMNRDDFQVVSPISSIAMSKACTSDSGK